MTQQSGESRGLVPPFTVRDAKLPTSSSPPDGLLKVLPANKESFTIMKLFLILSLLLVKVHGQWSELEVRKMLEETNERHKQIERMTKEAAIRHNQENPDGESISERQTPPPPIPPPAPPEAPRIIRLPPPTIEDDRTFLARMSEQEALVNQLNALSNREAATRNGLLAMGQTLDPIAQSPPDNRVEIQARPISSQLPMREYSKNLDLSETVQQNLDDVVLRNETIS